MDIYEDFASYIEENSEFINILKSTSSPILVCFEDAITVCNQILEMYRNKETIENEISEIFEIGYGYLSNVITEIKNYYIHYFNSDIICFNKFGNLMIYLLLIDDFKQYLLSNEELEQDFEAMLNELLLEIDESIKNKVELTLEKEQEYTNKLDMLGYSDGFQPTYSVFYLISEELKR